MLKINLVFYRFLTLFIATSLLAWQGQALASFNKALEHYKNKDFAEAFYSFKNMAYVGDRDSQFNLGVMYYRGEHVDKDLVQAYGWMQLAAAQGVEKYQRLSKQVYDSLDDKAKQAADQLARELDSQYGQEVLQQALAPKLLSDDECTQDPVPIDLAQPKYPRGALSSGKLGYVDILLNISPQGYGRDITVRAVSDEVFFKASAKAAYASRWTPSITGGEAVVTRGTMYRYSYMGYEDGTYRATKFVRYLKEIEGKAQEGDAKSQYSYAKNLSAARSFKRYLSDTDLDLEYSASNKWFAKSAAAGHPLAQYELGKNMLYGKGCEVDKEAGLKWLRAAAIAGHSFAQEELAMSTLNDGVTDVKRTMTWLRKAADSKYFAPKLFLAWELATSPVEELRDGNEALQLLGSEHPFYYDDVRIFETQAAAYAQTGDFKTAVKWQKKALKLAAKKKWDIPVMQRRLEAYEQNKTWTGVYHEPILADTLPAMPAKKIKS